MPNTTRNTPTTRLSQLAWSVNHVTPALKSRPMTRNTTKKPALTAAPTARARAMLARCEPGRAPSRPRKNIR
jgi:hypothetical protein